jgi:hypothetical protein
VVAIPTWVSKGFRFTIHVDSSSRGVTLFAAVLGLSLILSHIVFH